VPVRTKNKKPQKNYKIKKNPKKLIKNKKQESTLRGLGCKL
jgi:hypothetical protein